LLIEISECRENIAKFFNAQTDEIFFTSGATESLNLIIKSFEKILKKDDEVILSYLEHASNLLC
jgi:cysteine desulfurase/selenocysteine lyase